MTLFQAALVLVQYGVILDILRLLNISCFSVGHLSKEDIYTILLLYYCTKAMDFIAIYKLLTDPQAREYGNSRVMQRFRVQRCL